MTVKELIEALQALTPEQQELPVWVLGFNGMPTEAVEADVQRAMPTCYNMPAKVFIQPE